MTLARLLLVPALYVLALEGRASSFAILFPLAGGADALDGWIARHYAQESEFGRKLDSTTDALFYYSIPLWFSWLLPQTVQGWWPWLVLPGGLFLAGETVKVAQKRPIAALHLPFSRIAAGVVLVYLTWVLWADPPRFLFHAAWMLLTLAALGELMACLSHPT